MNRDEFDRMIGSLDRDISEMMVAAKNASLDAEDRQTLKHHAEDIISAGRRVLELHAAWKQRLGDTSETPPCGQGGAVADLTARRTSKETPEQVAHYATAVSFEGREVECSAEGCRDFVLGYESGLLHGRLSARPSEWSGTYHADNHTMLEREAADGGYSIEVERTTDPAWVYATFRPLPLRRVEPVPSATE